MGRRGAGQEGWWRKKQEGRAVGRERWGFEVQSGVELELGGGGRGQEEGQRDGGLGTTPLTIPDRDGAPESSLPTTPVSHGLLGLIWAPDEVCVECSVGPLNQCYITMFWSIWLNFVFSRNEGVSHGLLHEHSVCHRCARWTLRRECVQR